MSFYGQQQQQPPQQGSFGAGAYGQQQQQQPADQWQQQPPSSGGYGGNDQQQQWGQQAPQQTQQSQSQQPNFWNPSTAAAVQGVVGAVTTGSTGGLSGDAMLDLAGTAGKSFLKSGSARMVPGLEAFMHTLRSYFAVDNRYVKRKMIKLLFPFLSKEWSRQASDPAGPDMMQVEYALPYSDENAPDLYLPSMSLITYVLLCAICYGTAGEFDPEVLPDVTTKCFATQIMEVLVIRFGFYMMQAPVAMLDLFSYTGYKYLGLCLNMLAGLLLGHLFGLGHRAYYVFFLWTSSAASYFMLKTMANNIPVRVSTTGPKREVMVCAFAASQFATMWFVSQTKFL